MLIRDLFFREVGDLGRHDRPRVARYLDLARAATAATAARGRDENALFGETEQHRLAALDHELLLAVVHVDRDIAVVVDDLVGDRDQRRQRRADTSDRDRSDEEYGVHRFLLIDSAY